MNTTEGKAKHLDEIDLLFRKITTIHSEPTNESDLIEYICEWLVEEHICEKHEILKDRKIGIFIQKQILVSKSSSLKNGVMFCGHLDSLHLPSKEDLSNTIFERKENKLHFKNLKQGEELGLDDKTGIVTILKLLKDLKNEKKFKENELEEVFVQTEKVKEEDLKSINFFVYFSICEEIGQKGIIFFPIEKISSKIDVAIAIDRKTDYHEKNIQHYVNKYMGIPTIHKNHEDMIYAMFNKAAEKMELGTSIDRLESKNMSDILELRGRIDCEVILNDLVIDDILNDELSRLLNSYQFATNAVMNKMDEVKPNESIGGFKSPLRSERYQNMKKINEILYSKYSKQVSVEFSCLNFSMDYDEQNQYMDLKEIQNTVLLMKGFIEE
eukprot:gene3401-5946_t